MKKKGLGLLLILIALGLLVLSMPPFGCWPLLFIGLALMLLVQFRIFSKKTHWMAPAILNSSFFTLLFAYHYGFRWSQLVQFYPFIFVSIFLLTWLFGRSQYKKTIESNYRFLALESALVWVGVDIIRNALPMFGTTGFIGYACYRLPWMIQPVSVLGMYPLNFVLAFVGFSLGVKAIVWYDRYTNRVGECQQIEKPANKSMIISGIIFSVWVITSIVLYVLPDEQADTQLKVAALQPKSSNTEVLMDLTTQAVEQGAQLVLWPKAAAIEGNIKDDDYGKVIRDFAKQVQVYIVVYNRYPGYKGVRLETDIIDPRSEVISIAGKDHPLKLLGESASQKDVSKGAITPFGKLGTADGYDLLFINTAQKISNREVELILALSDNKQFLAKTFIAYTQFRALENKVSIINVEPFGGSVFITPKGEIIKEGISKGSASALVLKEIAIGHQKHKNNDALVSWIFLMFMVSLIVIRNITISKRFKKSKQRLESKSKTL